MFWIPRAASPQGPLAHGLGAVDRFESQDRPLKIGRQEQEVEQLRHPRPREPELARHGGPVGHEAAVDGALQVVREGEHPGHLGGSAYGLGLRGRRRLAQRHT